MIKKAIVLLSLIYVIATPFGFTASDKGLWRYYVIPGTPNVHGNQGTFWRADLSVVNPYSWKSITVYIRFLEQDVNNTNAPEKSYNISAGRALFIEDVVQTAFNRIEINGAIEIYTRNGDYFLASARVFTGSTETYGQTATGQEWFGDSRSVVYQPGIRQTSRFRCNVGAVNVSSVTVRLEAVVYDVNGTERGRKTFEIKPNSHMQQSIKSFTSNFNSGYIVWRCLTSGSNLYWTTYASVVDNETGDAVFVEERIDDQYVQYRPYHDQTGWWEGTVTSPQGGESGYLLIGQDGSELTIYIYRSNGRMSAIYRGYEDRGVVTLTETTVYDAPCWNTTLVDSNLTSEAGAIHGNITISADRPYECIDGSMTLYFTPRSSSPF
jgi:hypothetical protein